jgi:phosphate-selective porin OprO/OprP
MNFRITKAALMAGAAFFGSAALAQADQKAETAAELAADQQKLQALQRQIEDLSGQVDDLKRSTANQYADTQAQRANDVKVTLDNGRPTFSSADGQFTAAIRLLSQLDWAYYSQGAKANALPAAYAPDLSSGANFRRVYLGVQGKVFGDWSYNLNFDFGGSSGTEAPGHIQSVYIEYDGFGPFAIRAGAYPAPANLEDGTAAGDTIFLERNASSDLQRNIAGGDGRDAVSLLYLGDSLFGALSYTGNKVQETGSIFGEQQSLLGRASYLIVNDPDAHWLVGANGTYVMAPQGALARNVAFPGTNANGTARETFTLSDPPELTVDENSLKLANTTALSAKHVSQWGVETAGNWRSLYGQAGYYGFDVDRGPEAFTAFTAASTSHATTVQPLNDGFSGWYAQFAWTLTGEERKYNPATGAFTPPKPAEPFNLGNGTWGAFEIAGRYSDLDLNDRTLDNSNVVTAWSGASKTYTYYNTVRGGDQRIWTAALNWYPINDVKLALQYQYIQISRLQSGSTPSTLIAIGPTTGTPALPTLSGGQNLQTVAVRVQFQL